MKYRIYDEECVRCGSDNIIRDFLSFKCMNCGCRWFDKGYEPTERDLLDIKKEARIESKKNLFAQQIRRRDVQSLFSPSDRFFTNFEDYADLDNPRSKYHYELGEQLLEGASFYDLKRMSIPKGCSESDFNSFISDFLSSRDELPFSPTLQDWASYLHVEKEELDGIYYATSHVDLSNYLEPQMGVSDFFDVVFSGRILEVKNRVPKNYLDFLQDDESIDDCFSAYAVYGNSNFISEGLFNNEKRVIDRYFDAIKTKKQELFGDAIKRKLSIIDTVMLFVDYAFEGYGVFFS